jgi:hypothetical protein
MTKSILGIVLFAVVGCSSASPGTTGGGQDGQQTQEQSSTGSGGDAPVVVTPSDPDAPAPSADGGADAAPVDTPNCQNGALACGKPDGNLYTCMNGAWTKTKTCTYGCATQNGTAACKPNPFAACCSLIKARPTQNDNFCFAAPGTAECPMTAAGGYCDPNGDKSYTDGDWVRGYNEFRKYCL